MGDDILEITHGAKRLKSPLGGQSGSSPTQSPSTGSYSAGGVPGRVEKDDSEPKQVCM
jgi:hypothetical protein